MSKFVTFKLIPSEMIQRLLLVFLIALTTSCQFFETEKVSSEQIYEEEIHAINWTEVDTYPSFSNCENSFDKQAQRDCFINTINKHLFESISQENMLASSELSDTLLVDFEISKDGRLSILNISIDSVLKKDFPQLEKLIFKSIDSLQPIAPAYKRGIPVKTQFTLPVVISTD